MEQLFEEEKVEVEIDLSKKFQFPTNVVIKNLIIKILLFIQKGFFG